MNRAKTAGIVLTVVSAAVCLIFVSLAVVRLFFIDYSIIPQNGMYPGLPTGSRLLSWKRPYKSVAEVTRGDVVLFDRTENNIPYRFIWRVIGLPGDKIDVTGDKILINEQPLSREEVRTDGEMIIYKEGDAQTYEVAYPRSATGGEKRNISLTVPDNHLFVLGDNRFNARDSVYFGPIPFASIAGKKL